MNALLIISVATLAVTSETLRVALTIKKSNSKLAK